MKENRLPGASHNPSRWGKWLLAVGLLFVAGQGVFHLYAVQSVFFPGVYYKTELKLINHACSQVDKDLQKLLVKVYDLQKLSSGTGQMRSRPANGLLSSPNNSVSSGGVSANPVPGWRVTLLAAKMERRNVSRKLKKMDIILISMQRSLQSNDVPVALKRAERQKILAQIRQIRERCRIYKNHFKDLSEKLNKLEKFSPTLQTNN